MVSALKNRFGESCRTVDATSASKYEAAVGADVEAGTSNMCPAGTCMSASSQAHPPRASCPSTLPQYCLMKRASRP